MKRIISFLLVFTLMFAAVPAFAANADSFKDVPKDAWYYKDVDFVTRNNMFNGTSVDKFSPGVSMARGMFITVLGRYAKVPSTYSSGISAFINRTEVNIRSGPSTKNTSTIACVSNTAVSYLGLYNDLDSNSSHKWAKVSYNGKTGYVIRDLISLKDTVYTDVPVDMYYSPYIHWAHDKGLIEGMGTSTFTPNKDITREEICYILNNFSKAENIKLPETKPAISFIDAGNINPAYKDAVARLTKAGVINGFEDSSFRPKNGAQRCHVAKMLHSFIDGINYVPEEGGGDEPEVPSVPETPEIEISGDKMLKVGIKYYYSPGRDSSLSIARLQNAVGSGFEFGFFDSNRNFNKLASTTKTKITMTPTGGGKEIVVKDTDTDELIYTHSGADGKVLAVKPISNSGKAQTWFSSHKYYGAFEYFIHNNSNGRMSVINVVGLEDYVKGVVPYEMSPSWPLEALKAQAVCARTYALRCIGNYGAYGFDLTSDTYSQAYLGTSNANSVTEKACEDTKGKVATYNGHMCQTFYFSSDGGATESSENIFGGKLPYCRGKIDPYEADVPQSLNGNKSWSVKMTGDKIASKLGASAPIVKIDTVLSDVGNVIKIIFEDEDGAVYTREKSACYSSLGLKSVHYTVSEIETETTEPENEEEEPIKTFAFNGAGWGHNVGMSQWGAYSMAKNHGKNYIDILKFYYTGIDISALK